MSYWGKFVGGMAGFAMGGPVGALFGMALGHAADGKMHSYKQFGGFHSFQDMFGAIPAYGTGGREQTFAVSVTVLGAKLCKADGPVSRTEVDAFKRVFLIPPQSADKVAQLFDRAKESPEGFETYATQLGQAFADDPHALEQVLSGLYHIARADGPLNQAETEFLTEVASRFRLSQAAQARASGATASGSGSGGTGGHARGRATASGTDDPYKILGLVRSATHEEIRIRWKQLVREYHPDVLSSKGASPARIHQASDKVAKINAAYDSIKRERGL
jgi:DnaJ like chaperone protein